MGGRQIWFGHQSSSHAHGHGHGQHTSFEDLQRLTESPFENNTSLNLTVPLGDTAFLRCKVRNLGERSVSNSLKQCQYIYNEYSLDSQYQCEQKLG